MRSRSSRKYRTIGWIIVVCLLPVAILYSSTKVDERSNLLSNILHKLSYPFQFVIMNCYRTVRDFVNNYIYLVELKRENLQLRRKLSELKGIQSRLTELQHENERLRKIIGFIENSNPHEFIVAKVISSSISPYFHTIKIDKGSRDGIRDYMPVVCPEGVVGRVLNTHGRTSDVLLLTDTKSSIDVIFQRTRSQAILKGMGDLRSMQLKAHYLGSREPVKVDDLTITSGMGGVYPKGLVVGRIVELLPSEYGLFKDAKIKMSAKLTELEEVLILKWRAEDVQK